MTFGYSAGKLVSISDPAARVTTFTVSGGALVGVAPYAPAGQNHARTFAWTSYTGGAVLPSYQQNALGQRDSLRYSGDWPQRLVLRTVLDENGGSVRPDAWYEPAELKGLGATASLDTVYARAVDARGTAAWATRNRWGQTLRSWDAIGTLGVSSYGPDGRLLTSEGRQGDSTRVTWNYDALGRLVSSYSRGATGVLVRRDSLQYDASHRLSKRVDTFGNWTSFGYSAFGAPTLVVTSFGDTTLNVYNAQGRLDSTHVSGAIGYTRYVYEPTWGNTSSVRTPDGALAVENTYDSYSRLTDARSKVTVRVTSATSELQWRRRRPYYNGATGQVDSLILERTANCAAPCTTPSWPAQSDTSLVTVSGRIFSYLGRDSLRTIRVNGAMQVQERVVFDALGRLVSRSRPDASGVLREETFRYDAGENLRFAVTRRGYSIETRYDSRGRPYQRIIPTVGTFDLTYGGPNDELTAVTAQSGYADAVGGSNVNAAWGYDQSGRLRTETVQGSRTTTYGYDAYDRMSSYADAIGTSQVRFHASRGTPDTLITPQGDRVAYTVDGSGRLTGPVITGGAQPFQRRQEWAPRGGLLELWNESGTGGSYYAPGRFVRQDVDPPTAYDSLSPEWHERAGLGAGTVLQRDSLGFDGWERVTMAGYWKPTVFDSVGGELFGYDARGNLTVGAAGGGWSFASPGNQLLSGAGCTFSYDVAGNLIQRTCGGAVTSYTYDALERLTHVQLPGGASAAYSYDALGQRLATWSSSAGTVRFVWRGGHVAYETDGGGALQRSYTWGADTDDLVAIQDHAGGQRYYPVQDGLRSVRALVRADGAWSAGRRYKVYGGQLVATGSDPFPLRFRWAGAQYDEETGLYYLRNRYYDPGLGRFTQEDPIGFGGGGNLYGYSAGNPTVGRDPSGLAWSPDFQFQFTTRCWNLNCSAAWSRSEVDAHWALDLGNVAGAYDTYLRNTRLWGPLIANSLPLIERRRAGARDAVVEPLDALEFRHLVNSVAVEMRTWLVNEFLFQVLEGRYFVERLFKGRYILTNALGGDNPAIALGQSVAIINETFLRVDVASWHVAHIAVHEFWHLRGNSHDTPSSCAAFSASVYQLVPSSVGRGLGPGC